MIVRLLPLLALAALSACQSASPPIGPGISAPQAVFAAAEAAPRGVSGTFALVVRRAEMVGPRLFLNSEEDYRDQRNLSIAIQPGALAGLERRLGGEPRRLLLGRDIRVSGMARRTRIDFTDGRGRPTGKYYYQTHVAVMDPAQMVVVGG